jgi:hypothetical protein
MKSGLWRAWMSTLEGEVLADGALADLGPIGDLLDGIVVAPAMWDR